MSILDLYSSAFLERNRDHFAAIVRIALSDGEINEEEKAFLDRLASNLDISEEDYKAILKNPEKYPINPPLFYESRLHRLYDLTCMVYADHIADEEETQMLYKLAIGLGFTPGNVKYIVNKAYDLVSHHVDLETFKEEMRHMNR
ncbi:TerB family tellurite resistance protein [Sinomicrobium weinanense]|uniref:TerB family tellurite resistance protein n=1 Tax=Sinomicrobium weinanense TaxID=2842200 RepID=A0A926JUH6_9FLAO|nr:TerB family tellurite resistance protein [Sinomicrobium weinanense]MBC9797478.1 TerB family tellurite resistance protein [Sinomicrobium weinanense]MBU3124470.1 TerB family tellurite resistance protein [Sinomicrobium weinanense]